MAPVMIAALFWKRSTKWGALVSTLFVAGTLISFAFLQGSPAPPPVAPAKPVAAATPAARRDGQGGCSGKHEQTR